MSGENRAAGSFLVQAGDDLQKQKMSSPQKKPVRGGGCSDAQNPASCFGVGPGRSIERRLEPPASAAQNKNHDARADESSGDRPISEALHPKRPEPRVLIAKHQRAGEDDVQRTHQAENLHRRPRVSGSPQRCAADQQDARKDVSETDKLQVARRQSSTGRVDSQHFREPRRRTVKRKNPKHSHDQRQSQRTTGSSAGLVFLARAPVPRDKRCRSGADQREQQVRQPVHVNAQPDGGRRRGAQFAVDPHPPGQPGINEPNHRIQKLLGNDRSREHQHCPAQIAVQQPPGSAVERRVLRTGIRLRHGENSRREGSLRRFDSRGKGGNT